HLPGAEVLRATYRGVSSLGLRISRLASLFHAHDKLRVYRKLLRGQPHGFTRNRLGDAFHFVDAPAGFNHSHPILGRSLAFTHSGFGRLLRDRLVRKNADPDFAAALDETRDGDSARLDLPVRDPRRIERLQTVITERQRRTAPRLAAHATALLLAVLHFLGHQHDFKSSRLRDPAAACSAESHLYKSSTSRQ